MNTEQTILSVSQLNNQAKFLLENKLSHVWVEGEISSLRQYSSGHIYFTLKDASGEISSVLFSHDAQKLSFIPENGQKVIMYGGVSLYSPRGQFQFKVKNIHISGKGDLWEAYEHLKRKLESEGLFDSSQKKKIPSYPEKIGVITSADGSVIRDIINVINRRSPHIHIMLYPSLVQGEIAVDSLINGIEHIHSHSSVVDAIIIGRGGGSMEDLWCFNNERLVRAIANSKIPIISAVGHETDFTLSDFAADLRAPTPSAAAELLSPVRDDLYQYLDEQEERLLGFIQSYVLNQYQIIEMAILSYGFHKPEVFFDQQKEKFNKFTNALVNSAQSSVEKLQKKLEVEWEKLQVLNPKGILERGYSLAFDEDGQIINTDSPLEKGTNINIHFSNRIANTTVNKVEKK
ncbi:MAG: exodeoxyribonuclease VII large subunit [Candidatus Marinimicrobia bacterium]|nr:exodeoxyribonuclease VII large subunit [Candidatus Neomarinimicrobiota bacterium]